MDCAACPRATQIGFDTTFVQQRRNLAFRFPCLYKLSIHPTDRVHLLGGSRHQYDPICLNTLLFPTRKLHLGKLGLIDQPPAQSVSGWATLPKPVFDKPALACEHLGRQLSAVLASHGSFDAFDDRGNRAPIVLELLSTIVHADASARASIFVIGAFICILKATPATDVVDQNCSEIRLPALDLRDQPRKRVAPR